MSPEAAGMAAAQAVRGPSSVAPAGSNAHYWPVFTAVACGSQTDRERLGLPLNYVTDRFDGVLSGAFSALRGECMDGLLAALQDAQTPLVRRYAAGQLLALQGDPRISPYSPPMVDIPGGSVEVGLAEDEVDAVMARYHGLGIDVTWIRKECPRHPVVLAPYRIGRYPVTNQEFQHFLRVTGFPELPQSWAFRRFPQERANHPVYGLTAQACDRYAAWLAERSGRRFRLPTEAEWEYAAAGPEGREFPWGEAFDAARANCCETGIFDTTPVGLFPAGASPFGVLDMAGNVEEYVADEYAAYPGGSTVDDQLLRIHGSYRVARGGCFARYRDLARTRRRHGHNPRSATYAMGFRLAESL